MAAQENRNQAEQRSRNEFCARIRTDLKEKTDVTRAKY